VPAQRWDELHVANLSLRNDVAVLTARPDCSAPLLGLLRERDKLRDRFEEAVGLLREIEAAVRGKLGTMNFYFGPGARTAVSPADRDAYARIKSAQERIDAFLASLESE
jgi:hypothetical protein